MKSSGGMTDWEFGYGCICCMCGAMAIVGYLVGWKGGAIVGNGHPVQVMHD